MTFNAPLFCGVVPVVTSCGVLNHDPAVLVACADSAQVPSVMSIDQVVPVTLVV